MKKEDMELVLRVATAAKAAMRKAPRVTPRKKLNIITLEEAEKLLHRRGE